MGELYDEVTIPFLNTVELENCATRLQLEVPVGVTQLAYARTDRSQIPVGLSQQYL